MRVTVVTVAVARSNRRRHEVARKTKPVAAVVGVGPGNGSAVARVFSGAGYAVGLLARRAEHIEPLAKTLPDAAALTCDVTDDASIERAFAAIRGRLGDVEVLLFNASGAVWGNVEELGVDDFEAAWRVDARGLYACAKQVIPAMQANGRGSILVVSAGAARRGRAGTAAFAPAKAAQRSLAESMAHQLGPQGIHVAIEVIDGVVDLPRSRARMRDKPDDFFVKPQAVAENLLWLARQDRSAWSFEIEARPFGEKW